jgi:hypothetical protein
MMTAISLSSCDVFAVRTSLPRDGSDEKRSALMNVPFRVQERIREGSRYTVTGGHLSVRHPTDPG